MKMLKKSLIAIALLACVMPAFAGEKKIHDPWPCAPIPQEVCKIDVVMDVGYWIHFVKQDAIKVKQDSLNNTADPYHTYYGCTTAEVVETNFAADLTVSAAAVAGGSGSWSATISPSSVGVGSTPVTVCVTGKNVSLLGLTGGAKNVKVAVVTVMVVPHVG